MPIVHVIPLNDLRRHEETTMCECEPRLEIGETGGMSVIHNAFDAREVVEEITDHSIAPDKTWACFVDPEVGSTDQTTNDRG